MLAVAVPWTLTSPWCSTSVTPPALARIRSATNPRRRNMFVLWRRGGRGPGIGGVNGILSVFVVGNGGGWIMASLRKVLGDGAGRAGVSMACSFSRDAGRVGLTAPGPLLETESGGKES